ncbi:MAG: type I glutamate--ammonia ligase [Elusimicrobiota bacterium]
MFKTGKDLLEYIKKNKVDQVNFRITSIPGKLHHLTVPANAINNNIFEDGEAFDGSSVGFRTVEAGDLSLIPDVTTAFIDPFFELKTLSITCDIVEADSKKSIGLDPRGVAKRAEAYLKTTGVADETLASPEWEFYVFDAVHHENTINNNSYQIDSQEAEWNTYMSDQKNLGHKIPHHGGYHASPPMDTLHNFRSKVVKFLVDEGIPVRYHHHEVGGPGQCEIEVGFRNIVQAGDDGMLIKYAVKNFASLINKTATFMPKPLYNEAGSGMHIHFMLRKDGKPVFYDNKGYANLSKTALYFIGGILSHGPSLVAFTDPSTNSYKRLIPGFEAPVKLFFSLANRTAAIRIPKYAVKPMEKRFEFRTPDATCNIYLALAGLLMAGLDGVKKKIDPMKSNFGPYDEDLMKMKPETIAKIKSLPESIYMSLEALRKDNAYLTEGGVFTKELIDRWIEIKTKDADRVRNTPHPYEVRLYYDV